MLRKNKWVTGLGATFGSQGILISLLSAKDSKVTAVTFAGSSSLFDLFEQLSDKVKNPTVKYDFSKIDFVLIPSGSSWGREALDKKEVDIALTSTKRKETIYGTPNTSWFGSIGNLLSNPKKFFTSERVQERGLAEDLITFLTINSEKECFSDSLGGGKNWQVKYRDSVTSIFANHEKPQKQNNGLFGLFSLTGNHIIPCFEKWLGYSREGNSKRSSINKVVFEYQDNKKIDHLKIREIPENNYFALEFLRRESSGNSLLAIPNSFYEKNKDYLTNLGFQSTGLNTTKKRDLKFEIDKKEIENKHKKRTWINGLLANYNNFEKNFHLERTATYYDQNWQCIKERGYGDSVHELHEVTGSKHGVDERSVAKCEDQLEEKAKKNKQ